MDVIFLRLVKCIWIFINPISNNKKWLIMGLTYLIFLLLIVTVILGVLTPILEDINVNVLADTFEIVGPYYQAIVKLLITYYSINNIHNLLNTMQQHFWTYNKFGKQYKQKYLLIIKTVEQLFKLFLISVCFCILILILRPFLLKSNTLPFRISKVVDLSDYKQYFFMYFWQISNFVLGGALILFVDGLFIVFVTQIYIQLKMLKDALLLVGKNVEEECYSKIKEYIKHHCLILNCIESLTVLYSFQIFNQMIGNTASICMGLYIASKSGVAEYSATFKATTITTVFILELVMFCTAGTLITNACLEIADGAYFSGWQNINSKRIRFALSMIILRSNKRIDLKAANMFSVNLNGLTTTLKTSFSFYTLMVDVNEKKL